MGGGPVDNGRNVFSRTTSGRPSYQIPVSVSGRPTGNGNSYDYDLYNNSLQLTAASEAGKPMINGSPTYISTVPICRPGCQRLFLAAGGSKGAGCGVVLPIQRWYTGTAPDVGAYERETQIGIWDHRLS